MAGLLDYGAGAAEGLETLLARLRSDRMLQQAQQRIDEESRSNKSTEDYRQKALQETGELRKATLAATVADRGERNADRDSNRVLSRIKLRPIGSTVPPSELDEDKQVGGAPDALYERTARGPVGDEYGPQQDTTYKGTEEQQVARLRANRAPTSTVPSSEVKTVKYKGKPIDANYNPKTETYSYRGQDITADVEHYEKPPSPDRVLIQTENGYMPRADATRKIQGGGDVPLPTTSSTRTMEEGAKMLQPHIDSAMNQAEALDKANLFGPAMSRIRHLAAQAGTIDQFTAALDADPELSNDRRVGKFATTLSLLASGAGRVHGGARGGGSPQMYAQFKQALDDSGTLEMFLGRMEGLNEFIGGYAQGPGGAKKEKATGAADLIWDAKTGTFKKPGG